ncbi:MAG: alpha/beta fold hydrolase [Gemmatimonadota bacterium]
MSGAQEPKPRFRAARVQLPGGVVPVWTAGTGPTVLLLHGLSANHSQWLGVADRLVSRFHVVLPDLLGRGASRPEPGVDFSLATEVDRLERLLRAVGVAEGDPPLLVAGHSHGATLAVALACGTPVAGLALVNPVTPWTRRPAALELLRYAGVRRVVEPVLRACRRPLTRYILTRRVYADSGPFVESAVARYADPFADPERGRALLRVLRDWRPAALDTMRPAGVPTEVLAGGADRRIRPEEAARWAARLGAGFDVIEGVGHAVTEEAPERVAALIRRLAETGRTAVRGEVGEAEPNTVENRDEE